MLQSTIKFMCHEANMSITIASDSWQTSSAAADIVASALEASRDDRAQDEAAKVLAQYAPKPAAKAKK